MEGTPPLETTMAGGPPSYYRPGGYGAPPPSHRYRWVIVGVAIVLVIAVALLLLYAFVWGPGPATGGPYPYRFGLFGGAFALFFLLLVVFFVVRVVFWATRVGRYPRGGRGWGGGPGYGPDRPAMVARMRYARGEITREQYDQIMTDLERGRGSH